jgi:TonB family protein
MRLLSPLFPVLCVTFLASLGGCASSDAARRDDERAARERAWNESHSGIRQATYAEDGASPDPEMVVAGEEGTLNVSDVDGAIQQHRGELLDCYRLGSRSSQRAYGRAVLRFFVDGKGEVVDVAILESTVGNARVERCLKDIAVGVHLPPPAGHKPTTFEYPIEFTARTLTASRQKQP